MSAVSALDEPEIVASLAALHTRKSIRRRILSLFEAILLGRLLQLSWHNRQAGSPSIDYYFWPLLGVIFVIGLSARSDSTNLRLAARTNSAFLYTIRWLMAIWVVYAQRVQGHRVLAIPDSDLPFATLTTLLLFVLFIWPWSLPEEGVGYPDATRETYSSLLGMSSFAWVDNLLVTGWFSNKVRLDQIPTLSPPDLAATNVHGFRSSSKKGASLLSRILRHFRTPLIIQAVWASIHGVLSFVPTLLLQSILEQVERSTEISAKQSWIQVALLFFCTLLASTAESRSVWLGQKVGFRLKSIMTTEIYTKALRRTTNVQPMNSKIPGDSVNTRADVGAILNLLTTDASKVADAGANMHQVWSSVPVQVFVAIVLLYRTLGPSIFAGVALMAAMIPINSRIAQRFGAIQMQVMAASDNRIQSTTEMVRNIRIIKFFAWEPHFEQTIENDRAKELQTLRSRFILWSIAASIWYAMPLLITFASFFVYGVILRQPLTTSLAFTSLSLFNLLKMPLDNFVGMITRVQDTLTSIRRIETFLREEETEKYSQLAQTDFSSSGTLGFEHATFKWVHTIDGSSGKRDNPAAGKLSSDRIWGFSLKNLNVKFARGKLNVITGPTGSGKSSVLHALLGEMKLIQGHVLMPAAVDRVELEADWNGLIDSIAYCAQEAWLMNDSVRNNIIFGSHYVEDRYKAVLEACALGTDLQTLTDGDLTRVGERGVSLSGGQKQRIALARAVYSNASHLLLDDCFSALDSHTARWIFQKCLKGPLVNGRTVILATHNAALTAADAAFVVVLREGQVVASGSAIEIKRSANLPEFENLISQEPVTDHRSQIIENELEPHLKPANFERESVEIIQGNITEGFSEDPSDETQADGSIPWLTVFRYLRSMGGLMFWAFLVLSFIGQQFGAIATNWWVQVLCNAYVTARQQATTTPSKHAQGINIAYYFGLYASIIILYIQVGFARLVLISYGSLRASAGTHRTLIKSIMGATFAFFDKVSFGQIINRFSRDLQMVDQDLAVLALATLHFLVALFGFVVLIVITTPAFIVPGILIGIAYYLTGAIYITGTRNIKQIDTAQRTPLYQHFGESLSGIVTIRAYGAVSQYQAGNMIRIDNANRPSFFLSATERWLAFRLGLIGAIVTLCASSFAILGKGKLSSGEIGLTMSYVITFSEHVLWLIRYHMANLENMTALKRVQEYMRLPQEALAVIESVQLPKDWPNQGIVQYECVSARYDLGQELVLRNISFTANARERVGVVGRTGAGKSSLALTLLRGLEVESGRIKIDGMDTKEIGLRALRHAVAFVPQDPTLFSGTLRSNLDPFDDYSDEEMLAALEIVGLHALSDEGDGLPGHHNKFTDLSFTFAESGSNISQGQRQLICIARALLKKPKIVLLDEATASIDHKTDLKIQACVRELDATVITIAHRIRTVIDYDKIVVLDAGEVKECDHPWKLLQNKKSEFHNMCTALSDGDSLFRLAEAAWHSDRRASLQRNDFVGT
ncbi:P-loop containing nucleoside triphosphate hydrolase protein [Periconia macrospinosa]|uniref:P-loop containing nucleoside triphosphate hydrolase protein n=1 Tax=Periconia macrospinosa TaxID=97972 RepID=A0A2V1DYH1_9PLEO|nr:P-loop containing nucleoside triphosphate hydrolase protein [Periconia macrospinosa]